MAPERTFEGRRWVGTAYARAGSSGLASYVGAGAKLLDVSLGSRVRVGGEVDVWRQPVIDVNALDYYDRPSSWGINGTGFGAVSIIGPLSITGKLGYKSSSFVSGLPLGDGPHGYLGSRSVLRTIYDREAELRNRIVDLVQQGEGAILQVITHGDRDPAETGRAVRVGAREPRSIPPKEPWTRDHRVGARDSRDSSGRAARSGRAP